MRSNSRSSLTAAVNSGEYPTRSMSAFFHAAQRFSSAWWRTAATTTVPVAKAKTLVRSDSLELFVAVVWECTPEQQGIARSFF